MKKPAGGFAFIELLIVLSEQGIDTSSPSSIVDSVKKKLQNIKKDQQE
jgi:hypothetical protein